MGQEDRTILPGESRSIRVKFTPDAEGIFTNHIYVHHNVGSVPALQFDITGSGRHALGTPKKIDLGSVTTAEPFERIVALDVADGTNVRILSSGCTVPYLRAVAKRVGHDERALVVQRVRVGSHDEQARPTRDLIGGSVLGR